MECEECGLQFPDTEETVELHQGIDVNVFCSCNCLVAWVTSGGVDESCMKREGMLAANAEFNERLARIVDKELKK